jgi:hypothetical protein
MSRDRLQKELDAKAAFDGPMLLQQNSELAAQLKAKTAE